MNLYLKLKMHFVFAASWTTIAYEGSPGGLLKTWKTSNICKLSLFWVRWSFSFSLECLKLRQNGSISVQTHFDSFFFVNTSGVHDNETVLKRLIKCKNALAAKNASSLSESLCLEALTWRQGWKHIWNLFIFLVTSKRNQEALSEWVSELWWNIEQYLWN